MLVGFAVLFALAAAGEVMCRALGLPLGGAVPALVALAAWLACRPAVPVPLARAADALLAEMGLLFVPAGVGVLVWWPVIRGHAGPLLLALCGGTLAGLLAAALAFALVRRRRARLAANPALAEPAAEPAPEQAA